MIVKNWRARAAGLGLAGSVAVSGALLASGNCALAQSNIVPDNTLANEGSVVIPNFNGQPIEVITGGATRGANLFHSFGQFNVSEGRGAYFFSPSAAIQNILARVTGNNRSEILGTLGTLGGSNPNLFLMNPNGIVFGPGATLDVGGSFVATTANAIQFGNRGFFSASDPTVPSLLTVNPSAFLFSQITAQPITSQAAALQVPAGQSLLLLGGNVNLEGGSLFALGGRIELAGASGPGSVDLNETGRQLSLSFPEDVARADVVITNSTRLGVFAEEGGDIAIYARNLNIAGGSSLEAGIAPELGTVESQAGDITFDATASITIDNSFAVNKVFLRASGNAGDLTITTASLLLTNGARLITGTLGIGDGGNLRVRATDSVAVVGTSADGRLASGLFAQVNTGAEGQAGDLSINTARLLVRDGARISASTFGLGPAGSLRVRATDSVEVIGTSADRQSVSGLFVSVDSQGKGQAGDLSIETARLLVRDGARIAASTLGIGDGGSLRVRATDSVELIGTSADGQLASGLLASVNPEAEGKGGDLSVETARLLVRDGARISASTSGLGPAGSLRVRATDSVALIGTSADRQLASGLFAQVSKRGEGQGGDLSIHTARLLVHDGARISANTLGIGDGGSLRVRATDSVELIGTSADGRLASGLFAQVNPGAKGQGGDLNIETSNLMLRDGALLSSTSSEQYSAGDITLTVLDTLQADNGTIATSSTQNRGGSITITAGNIRLRGDSDITTSVFSGEAGGGNITLKADSIIALDDSDILAFSQDGSGGNVTLDTPVFFGFRFQPAPRGTDPRTLDGNDRVDINATGRVSSGTITLPDVSFIQNSLAELSQNLIDPNALVANSCIARGSRQGGSFTITGPGGLPTRPGDANTLRYSTVGVRPISEPATSREPSSAWKIGDPIVEPDGVYHLADGKLVLSQTCR